jgi:hypothetical protein
MVGTLVLAATQGEQNAEWAKIFRDSADEIAKIDVQNSGRLDKALAQVAIKRIRRWLGGSAKEFARGDKRRVSLLMESATDVFDVSFRNPAHAYDFLCPRLRIDICNMKRGDRKLVEELVRRISKKMMNGHADVHI